MPAAQERYLSAAASVARLFELDVFLVGHGHGVKHRRAHAALFERAHALDRRARGRANAVLEHAGVLARLEHHFRRAEHHLRGILDRRRARQAARDAAVGHRL